MKLKVDKNSDTLYFRLDDSKIIGSEEIQEGVILDFNADGKVVGIELLNISKRDLLEELLKYNFTNIELIIE